MGLMAQRAIRCHMLPCVVSLSPTRLTGQMKDFRCQRPFLKRAIVAQALEQTGSDSIHERMKTSAFSKGARYLGAPCVAALASALALVAASPAAATLGPADVLQLQETLNEVWGERNLLRSNDSLAGA